MNNIKTLFKNKKKEILSIYFTAGHPTADSVVSIIDKLEKNGVDMIEIGIPFSDPLADGPVIQKSSQKALKNGMTLQKIIHDLKNIRQQTKIPLLLMGYLNTVLQYGIEKFCKDLAKCEIDGVILPDMPIDVYEDKYMRFFEEYGIIPVFLISPNTTEERIRKTEKLSKGFIYVVSSASTTGSKKEFDSKSEAYFKRINDMQLSVPTLIGFGVSNKKTFNQACSYTNGAIIGSAFVKAIDDDEILENSIPKFIEQFQ